MVNSIIYQVSCFPILQNVKTGSPTDMNLSVFVSKTTLELRLKKFNPEAN